MRRATLRLHGYKRYREAPDNSSETVLPAAVTLSRHAALTSGSSGAIFPA